MDKTVSLNSRTTTLIFTTGLHVKKHQNYIVTPSAFLDGMAILTLLFQS
ncbi:hypothetical protein [Ferruginibacter sp.]|nr:hypothetical protein [Ferruginibacter sp.]